MEISKKNLAFIHIGKTGGTTVGKILWKLNCKYIHCQKVDINKDYKYIIWLRNPLARFVSAFNFIHRTMITDVSQYTIEDCNVLDDKICMDKYDDNNNINKNIFNEIAEYDIKLKIINNNKFLYNTELDDTFKYFENANNLAESLSSSNNIIKQKAENIMNMNYGHVSLSIGFYLNNGKLIENIHEQILFVGKQETMNEDLVKLGEILNINININNILKNRENIMYKDKKYLSPLAIKNLIEWYKDSDYAALEILKKYNFISEATLESYYKYENTL
jgi:hypothetical protein